MVRSKKKKSETALSRFIPKIPAEKFLSSYFLKKHYLARENRVQLPQISVERLVSLAKEKNHPEVSFQAWGEGSLKGNNTPLDQVLEIYRAPAATVLVRGVEHLIPEVSDLLNELEREAGTPTRRKNCLAFFSSKGKSAQMHYDGGHNFMIHLAGKKRWRIAPNREVHPPLYHIVGSASVPAKLERMAGSFPKKMPKDHTQIDMRPGSFLYLPQGYWHETTTLEDSAHLTFCLFTKSWSDLILDRLEKIHLADPVWRAPAAGILAEGKAREKANKRFEALWGKLAQQLFFEQ